ncbi:MAG: CPBP family intramembrane metalloprotease [Acidobacteria bacterium]|nr:CPBP family intramembrane metalloprotease [Acidobacteriota bacterium]
MKPNWKYIILFVILAFGISAPIHLGYFDQCFKTITKGWIISDSVYFIAGLGPFFAGVTALIFQKSISDRITLCGSEPLKNILIALIPLFSFSIIGLENSKGIDVHYYAFIYASFNTIYAFLEEFGWRRYLQNALDGINKNWAYLLIATIWWIWHLRFETQFDLFIFPIICIGGGFLLGKLANDTRSILPVVSMHTLIILLTNSGAVTMNKMIGVGMTIIGWIIVEQIWKRKKNG